MKHTKQNSAATIQQHIHQFDKLYFKLKSHGTTLSEDLLAYKLLKSANLSEQDEKIIRGIVPELTLTNMKLQLKKMFNDNKSPPTSDSLHAYEINEMTQEDTPHSSFNDDEYQTFYTAGRNFSNYRPNSNYRPRYQQRQAQF